MLRLEEKDIYTLKVNWHINFTMNRNGTCVIENNDNNITLFSNAITSSEIKIIEDNLLSIGTLTSVGNDVFNIIEKEVYKISFK